MDNSKDFNIPYLISDDRFCKWVLQPNATEDAYWNNWLELHPNKKEAVTKAKQIILDLNKATDTTISKETLSTTWNQIEQRVTIKPKRRSINWFKRVAAIAATFLLIFTFFHFSKDQLSTKELVAKTTTKWIKFKNERAAVKRIELVDGSIVVLEPGSLLKYPTSFEGKIRKVELDGEAFFEIARDTNKAFYVYTEETVVRVLGTSFYVKAGLDDKNVEVIVKTGKVAVYKREDLKKLREVTPELKVKKAKPLLVTPNQKVVFNKNRQNMTKRLTSTPRLVKSLSQLPKLSFEDVSADEIFKALANAYEVEILYEEGTKVNCLMNTTLTDQSLFEKLEIICDALELSYKEKEARIFIQGKCQ